MILENTDVKRFQELMKNREIICFGSGSFLDQFFDYCPMVNQIKYLVDSNPTKWNTLRDVAGLKIEILSPEQMIPKLNENTIILVTAGKIGAEIVHQLQNMNIPENQEVFWSMFILRELESMKFLHTRPLPNNLKLTKEPLIPKIIHYCWVGNNPIPKQHQEYIDGWKRLCPDYEIICWNEKNYDIEKNQYMKQAYEAKKWGFVPDYIRKDVIYEYGGIYLDTDVELIKKPDDLLYQDAFCGTESARKGKYRVNFGLGYGARKGLPIVKELLNVYEGEKFEFFRTNVKIGPEFETEVMKRYGFKDNGNYQIIEGMTVYPMDFLSTVCIYSDDSFITNNTYAIHHNANSWNDKIDLDNKADARSFYKMCKKI